MRRISVFFAVVAICFNCVFALSNKSDSLYVEAKAMYDRQEYKAALAAFETLLEYDQDESVKDNQLISSDKYWLSSVYYKLGNVEEAKKLNSSFYELPPVDRLLIKKAMLYANSAEAATTPKQAVFWCKMCLDAETEALGPDHYFLYFSYAVLANWNYQLGNEEECRKYIALAKDVADKWETTTSAWRATAYYVECLLESALGNTDAALQAQEQAWTLLDGDVMANPTVYAICLSNYVQFNANSGKLDDVNAELNRVIEVIGGNLSKENAADMVPVVQTIDNIEISLGRADRSVDLTHQLLELLDKDTDQYAYALSSLGLLTYNLGKYKEAIPYLTEALEIEQKRYPNAPERWTEVLPVLGACYANAIDFDTAEHYYKEAAKTYKRLGKQYLPQWILTVNQLGDLCYKTCHYEQAVSYIEDCIKSIKKLNVSTSDLAYLNKELGDCYAKIDKAKANAAYKSVIDILSESELSKDNDLYVQSKIAIIDYEVKDINALADSVNRLMEEINLGVEGVGTAFRKLYIKQYLCNKLCSGFELERALSVSDELLELVESVPTYDRTNIYMNRCNILVLLNRYDDALTESSKFRDYTAESFGKSSTQYLTALKSSADILLNRYSFSDMDTVTAYGEEICEHLDSFDKSSAAYLYYSMCAASCFCRDLERQKSLVEGALESVSPNVLKNEAGVVAFAYRILCTTYRACGDLETALQYTKLLQSCIDKIDNEFDKFGCYNCVGAIFYASNELHDAEIALLNAYNLGKSFSEDYVGLLETCQSLANLYVKIGQNDLAAEYQAKENSLVRKHGKSDEVFGIQNRLNYLWVKYAAGLKEECWNEILALEECFKNEEAYGLAFGYSMIPYLKAQYYFNEGDYTTAADYVQKALILQKAVNVLELAINIYLAMGDYDIAQQYAKEYLSFIESLFGDSKLEHIKPYKVLGDMAMQNNDIQSAWDYYQKCFDVSKEYINENILTLTSKQREDFWNQYSAMYNIYLPKMSVEYEFPVDKAALLYDAALFSKGFLMSADQTIASIVKKASSEIVKLYKEYLSNKATLANMSEHLDSSDRLRVSNLQDSELLDNYLRERDDLKDFNRKVDEQERALTEKIREKYPDKLSFQTYTWQDVQRSLPKRAAAIEYLDFPADSTTNVVAALVLKKDSQCPEYRQLFRYKAADVITNYTIYQNTALGDSLITKLDDCLTDCDAVYYSPQGMLLSVALESLPRSESSLPNDLKLYRLSSTSALAGKRSKRKGYNATLFGGLNYDASVDSLIADAGKYPELRKRSFVADNSFRSHRIAEVEIEPLPGTLKEVESIADLLSNAKRVTPQVKVGNDGTETAFKALSGRYGNILHVSTHGFFDAANTYDINNDVISYEDKAMEQSGLLLAGAVHRYLDEETLPNDLDDGILKSSEIAKLDLNNVDLAVLSACETGLGAVTREGVFGLQRGFKKAGVNSILMSLWKVDDDATCALMTQFYANWLSGKPKYESLELAKDYIKSQAAWSSPFYWAAFILLDAVN